jgi:predicted O-linked N-acetylglucosamine transferase (SPINDLY family)
LPAAGQGEGIAFGSFNNLCKVSDATLRLWAAVLAAVPGSRLVLKAFGIEPERVGRRLAQAGIDSGRANLLMPPRDVAAHLACYQHLDVALDTFPYGGTTTTCEALWMGRPVVTLAGDRHASRVGASILHAIGRPGWVAQTPEEFVRIAADLAADRPLLGRESLGLRDHLKASLLLDHRAQAERFGHALRACWARWCEPDRPLDPVGADTAIEPVAELARA